MKLNNKRMLKNKAVLFDLQMVGTGLGLFVLQHVTSNEKQVLNLFFHADYTILIISIFFQSFNFKLDMPQNIVSWGIMPFVK